jgi:hypothetical protein
MHHQTLVQLCHLFERGVKCAKVGAARNLSKVVHHRQPYEHHVLVCKQHIQVPFGDSVSVPSIDIYIYIYAACQVPTLLGVTRSRLPQRDLILLTTYHNSTYCSLKPLAKMRLTLVLSFAALATGISGLALPGPHGKNSPIFPERDFLERDPC